MDNESDRVTEAKVAYLETTLFIRLTAELDAAAHCSDLAVRVQRVAIVARLAEAFAAVRGARKDAP